MNEYKTKQENKKKYYEEKSEQFKKESVELSDEAIKMSQVMPFGQPILVGHHSESKHRNHIQKTDNKMRKSIDVLEKAKYYEEKSKSLGTGGISQDDPEAIKQLN